MAYPRRGLQDVPNTGRVYYPSAAELANAQKLADANGFGTVGQPWNIESDGSTFEVPTDKGGLPGYTTGFMVRFGFGRGAFADFQPPAPSSGVSPQVGGAGVAIVAAAQPVVQAPAEPPPVAVHAVVQQADGSTLPIAATLTPAPAAAVTAPPAAAGGGFDFGTFLSALLKVPSMQPVEAAAVSAAAPYAAQAAPSLISAWVSQNKPIVYGGLALAGLGVFMLATRGGGRRARA